MKNPFRIEMTKNTEMGAWEIVLQVGGFKTRREAEESAKVIAEFMANDGGWTDRVQ